MRFGAAITTICMALTASFAQADTLAGTLADAYRNSNLIEANRATLRATDEGVAQAVAAVRPTLAATAALTSATSGTTGLSSVTRSLTISSSMTVYDGGQNQLAIKTAEENVKAVRQTLTEIEQSVLLSAVTAYMDMRRDTEFLRLEESNLEVIGQELQAARDRFEVGEVTRTSVNQAEARLEATRASLALRQGNLEIAREGFKLATGRYPGTLQAPPPLPRLPATRAEAQRLASQNHPSIMRAQHLVKAAELTAQRAKVAMGPSVSLTGSYAPTVNARPTSSISLSGTMTLYAGGALASAYGQALANAEKTRADLNQAARSVSQTVGNAWAQLRVSRATITARQKQIRAARVAFQSVREEARFGQRTTLDVLDAEQELKGAEANLAAARRDEYVAAYSLLSSMGLLTARHLGLSVQIYDPEENYNRVRTAPSMVKRNNVLERALKRAGRN